MIKEALQHINESNYSFAISEHEIKLRFRVSKNEDEIIAIDALWNVSYDLYKEYKVAPMKITFEDELFSYYECTLYSVDPRFSYVFYLHLKNGKGLYYSENGLSETYDFKEYYLNAFKIAYLNELDIPYRNPTFDGKIIYQIFPERFNMGDENKDKSYVNKPWDTNELKGTNGNREQNVFIGGDLKGIINKLDYIKSLNVETIYLTPICKSKSNHKYDVEDYFMIDPMFGDDETLKELVDEIHKRKMNIILDLVFNHSSNHNKLFMDVKKNGRKSKYFDFYKIYDDEVDEEKKNYDMFASVREMPKLNTNNYDLQDYLLSVGKYFIEKFHVDGYRLDVANEVSHSFWLRFKQELRRIKRDVILIGENWNNSYSFLNPNQFDSVMNYPFLAATKDFIALKKLNALDYKNRLTSLLMRYDDNTNRNLLNLIDSHDTQRFYEYVKPNKDSYFLAVLSLISYIGMPMVYYGDEIFMEGKGDPMNRKGMEWNSKEFNSKDNKLFIDILNLRKINAFKFGDISLEAKDDLFIIKRVYKNESYVVILNNTNDEKEVKINGEVILSNNYKDNKLLKDSFVVFKE